MRKDNLPDNPFMKISHELWLMLASAGGDIAKTISLLQKPVNWDMLLQLSVHHRVYPLVYKTLKQLSGPVVPEDVLGLLRQKYQENALQAMSMTGETVRMVHCLEKQGIRAVVLKGAPLAWRLYGDITIRPSRDIDILVPPGELEKAGEILENEGYCREYTKHVLTSRQLEIFLKGSPHSHHCSYQHSKKDIYLEIHWTLGNGVHALPLPTETNIKRIGMAGSLLPVLSDEEWLFYLMLHGSGHAWFRLRWLLDIVKFTQQECIDWGKIDFLAKSFGMQSILHQSFILANQIMAARVPPNFLSVVASDRVAWRQACIAMNLCLATADHEIKGSNGQYSKYWRMIHDFQVRVGWNNRFNYVLKNLFSPNIDDIKLIPLPGRLYALYYVLRPFTWFGRCLRKLRAGN